MIDVLLADDDAPLRAALARALHGYTVEHACGADELIEKARAGAYRLILTDNRMEDGYGDSGAYAIARIREFDPDTPIVLHTAMLSEELKMRALAAGATETMRKSSSVAQYRAMVQKYCGA